MKKLIPFLVLLAGASGAFAQFVGTVSFRNDQGNFPTPADRDVYFPDMTTQIHSGTWEGTAYVGTNFQARLLWGSDASSLQPATYTAPARFRNVATSSTFAGAWSGATRSLPGSTPGQVVFLQVQAWEAGPGATGRTYEEVSAAGGAAGLWGESAIFTYTVPSTGALPTDFYMNNFRSFSLVVPEPSVIGLGLIGVGALFLLRRRKA